MQEGPAIFSTLTRPKTAGETPALQGNECPVHRAGWLLDFESLARNAG
jgi:hypothetical protein